ncbi:hypothetical protein [Ferrimonas balearica]|uniref:hypothetical protein n=1 Tax=Ferrimonas balearica TaxID=44012 RepID=UPI001C99A199|nr:hypothetical protein [Ferrimonas balearica]MBY5991606.1 hypothetical protein [Ferrimonas balearica]
MRKAIGVAVGLLALSGCSPQDPEQGEPQASVADPSLCQFAAGPCVSGGLALSLSPHHAPSEKPLALSLALKPGERAVEARIEGRDMFMGVIPVRFDDRGQAQAIYGSCASDYMVWRLTVTLENAEGERYSRWFDWLADAPTG